MTALDFRSVVLASAKTDPARKARPSREVRLAKKGQAPHDDRLSAHLSVVDWYSGK
jgi:hypothetical protein